MFSAISASLSVQDRSSPDCYERMCYDDFAEGFLKLGSYTYLLTNKFIITNFNITNGMTDFKTKNGTEYKQRNETSRSSCTHTDVHKSPIRR